MKIIVIGAGKIGFSIAELLSNEGHDVVVIDQDDERIELVDQTLDVQAVVGSGSSRKTLEAGGVGSADMVVAVTEMDELNMIACLLSKQYGARITVARVRNPEYVETSNSFIKELLGIDLILNPERVTAMEIADIIKNPELFNVDYYADGKVRMVEVLVEKDSPIAETKLKNLDTSRFVITAIMRNHRMFVPGGEDLIKVADHLYVMANATDIPEVLKIMGIQVEGEGRISATGL
jgi:trk system potassium uptake protein TrkA